MSHDIVVYQWTELPAKSKQDVIRLKNIRLYIASVRNQQPVLHCLLPVLRGDGKNPVVSLTAGPAYRLSDPDRYGKVVTGKLTKSEMPYAELVQEVYRADPRDSHIHQAIYNDMMQRASNEVPGPFNSPMWCRKASNRLAVYPKNNSVVCSDLGISVADKRYRNPEVKQAWDRMADNAFCIGYCSDGFLWDFDVILAGGVVCTPRQYGQPLDIFGVCLKSDLRHIIKTHKWHGVVP